MDKPLGCLTRSGLIAAIATVLIAGASALISRFQIFSPGALNASAAEASRAGINSHAEIPECGACHAAIWESGTMGERCLACHEGIRAEFDDPGSLHGVLEDPTRCQTCHTEHRGATSSLTRYDMLDFPHRMTGYSLAAHTMGESEQTVGCAGCHGHPPTTFQVGTCDLCHRDLDQEGMAAHMGWVGDDCLACHDGEDRYGAVFRHAETGFVLTGGHAEVGCAGCHAGAANAAALQATPRECVACHGDADVHGGALGDDCSACHLVAAWAPTEFDHQTASFELLGAHAEVACGDCHTDLRFLGTPRTCFECHAPDDPHAGELGFDCARCHNEEGWEEITLDHDLTAYPLEGAHVEASCEGCHVGGRFAGTPTECAQCHIEEDAHEGQYGTFCGACHQPTEWGDATFDHARSDFPLTGAHRAIPCVQCHEGAVFQPISTECSACHGDPAYHAGLFSANCSLCHSTSAWLPAQFNLAHSFPMGHEGAGGNCRLCHPDTLANYTCYGCHEHRRAKIREEHEEVSNLANCVRCHPKGREADDD